MSLYKMFKTDTVKENDGVPIRYSPDENGDVPTFYIARQGKTNKAYASALEKLFKPYQREITLGALGNKKAEQIVQTAFIRGVLKGWENVKGPSGEMLEFNEDNARKLFLDLPDLYEDLTTQANNLANFAVEDLETAAGN